MADSNLDSDKEVDIGLIVLFFVITVVAGILLLPWSPNSALLVVLGIPTLVMLWVGIVPLIHHK